MCVRCEVTVGFNGTGSRMLCRHARSRHLLPLSLLLKILGLTFFLIIFLKAAAVQRNAVVDECHRCGLQPRRVVVVEKGGVLSALYYVVCISGRFWGAGGAVNCSSGGG